MGYLFNGEILSKKDHPDEWAWIEKKKKELRSSNKKSFVFKAFPHPTYQKDETGKTHKTSRRRFISAQSTLINEDMDYAGQTWAYYPYQGALKNEGAGIFSLRNMGMGMDQIERYDIDHDIELIVYLKYISQNKFITEVDKAKEAKEKAEKEASKAEAWALIFSKRSSIHKDVIGSEEPLRTLAATWGLIGLDELSYAEIQNQLWDRVELSQLRYNTTKRGYDEFTSEALKVGDGEKRSTIMIGISKGVLKFNSDNNIWNVTTKGGAEQFLTPVYPGQEKQKDEILIKYLVENDRAYELVESAVNGSGSVNTEPPKTELTYQDKKNKAHKELGWPLGKLNIKEAELDKLLEGNIKYQE